MTVTNAQRMGLLTALRTPFTRVSGEKSQNKKDVFFPLSFLMCDICAAIILRPANMRQRTWFRVFSKEILLTILLEISLFLVKMNKQAKGRFFINDTSKKVDYAPLAM